MKTEIRILIALICIIGYIAFFGKIPEDDHSFDELVNRTTQDRILPIRSQTFHFQDATIAFEITIEYPVSISPEMINFEATQDFLDIIGIWEKEYPTGERNESTEILSFSSESNASFRTVSNERYLALGDGSGITLNLRFVFSKNEHSRILEDKLRILDLENTVNQLLRAFARIPLYDSRSGCPLFDSIANTLETAPLRLLTPSLFSDAKMASAIRAHLNGVIDGKIGLNESFNYDHDNLGGVIDGEIELNESFSGHHEN